MINILIKAMISKNQRKNLFLQISKVILRISANFRCLLSLTLNPLTCSSTHQCRNASRHKCRRTAWITKILPILAWNHRYHASIQMPQKAISSIQGSNLLRIVGSVISNIWFNLKVVTSSENNIVITSQEVTAWVM